MITSKLELLEPKTSPTFLFLQFTSMHEEKQLLEEDNLMSLRRLQVNLVDRLKMRVRSRRSEDVAHPNTESRLLTRTLKRALLNSKAGVLTQILKKEPK